MVLIGPCVVVDSGSCGEGAVVFPWFVALLRFHVVIKRAVLLCVPCRSSHPRPLHRIGHGCTLGVVLGPTSVTMTKVTS